MWTLVLGSNTEVDWSDSSYGEFRVPNLTNLPPSRCDHWAAIDLRDQRIYTYAGTSTSTRLADVWQYDIVTGIWTWIAASSTLDPTVNYPSSQGISSGLLM